MNQKEYELIADILNSCNVDSAGMTSHADLIRLFELRLMSYRNFNAEMFLQNIN